MEKIDVVLWAMGGGFAGTWMIMFFSLKQIREELRDMRKDIQDIDRRLCRLEGAFASKDFCVLKNDRQGQKAE